MRSRLAMLLGTMLLAACASTKPPAPAQPKAEPAPTAEPPPAHQNETPPAKPPSASATLTFDLPGGWARVPPRMLGMSEDDIDGVFLNPEKKGLILLGIMPGTDDPKTSAEQMRKVLADGGWKPSKIEASADGEQASITVSKKDKDSSQKGKITFRRVSGANMKKTLMLMGRWPAAADPALAKDFDAIVSSAAFK